MGPIINWPCCSRRAADTETAEANRNKVLTQLTTNVEIGMTLGPVISILMPLCALSLWINLWANAFAVSRLGFKVAGGYPREIVYFFSFAASLRSWSHA